jgi:two-component system sensor histidine kinase VicK
MSRYTTKLDNHPSAATASPPSIRAKKTEIVYGAEKAVARGVEFMANVKQRMDLCFDHRAPSIVIEVPDYRNGYAEVRKRGGAIRVVTEITKDNIQYCKKLMEMVELRHLPGVKGGIAVNESEYMATTVLEQAKPLTEVIYSNVPEMVSQGQHIFDIFWDNAIPAAWRIDEIEHGTIRSKTMIIERNDQIVNQMSNLANSSAHLSIVSPLGGLQLVYRDFFDIYKQAAARMQSSTNPNIKRTVEPGVEEESESERRGLRWITSINHDGINLVKTFLSIGIKIRHVKNLPPLSFALGNRELNASIERMEAGRMVESLLTSNEPVYVDHFEGIFAKLWSEGIEAQERIQELESGMEAADIEIIRNPRESIGRAWKLIQSAKKEVLLLLSSPNAFRRQLKMGGIDFLRKASDNGCSIRVLIPADINVETTIQTVKQDLPSIDIRVINEKLRTNITILIIDGKECFIFELRDDTRSESYEAVGISLHSRSHSIVSSYATIVESLWKEIELFEKLKLHDNMQRDFLDIATHELRTPIQPIVGLAEILRARVGAESEEIEFIDAILRNAKRLYNLTESLLDVTKIESKTLHLKMESFDLAELIQSVISDTRMGIDRSIPSSRIEYEGDSIHVFADRSRIYQVISNLLNNAIRFTKEGLITISVRRSDEDKAGSSQGSFASPFITVRVTDTGTGISAEIFGNLFSKFVSNSSAGTGLGLYISKAIIEGHGGAIWAKNNSAGRGAEFAFTLPLRLEMRGHNR